MVMRHVRGIICARRKGRGNVWSRSDRHIAEIPLEKRSQIREWLTFFGTIFTRDVSSELTKHRIFSIFYVSVHSNRRRMDLKVILESHDPGEKTATG